MDNKIEFIIDFGIQALASVAIVAVMITFLSCCVGLCLYLNALIDDMKAIATKLTPTELNSDKEQKISDEIITNTLNELVQFHTNILR